MARRDAASCESALGGGTAMASPKTPFLLTPLQRRRLLPTSRFRTACRAWTSDVCLGASST